MAKPSEKVMRDAMGNDVPLRYVGKYDRARDAVTRRILKRWEAARAMLERVHAETLADIKEIAKARGEAGIDPAAKGNMQVSSFDGNVCVSLNQRYEIKLDGRVAAAREMMLAYAQNLIKDVGGDDGKALLEIVRQTFEASKTGNLSMARISNLLKMNIRHGDWLAAKQMIVDAMTPEKGKCYIRVERRGCRQQDMEAVRLDIADCWPADTPA